MGWIDVEQETYVFQSEWAVARRAKEPLPGFIKITSAAPVYGVKIGLENVNGIEQYRQRQPSMRLYFRHAPASWEELGRQNVVVFKDNVFG